MTDFIQDFIDIKNFDASLVINPDSVHIKPHSSRVFETYITSSIDIKMLTNMKYFTKAFSPLTNKDLLKVEINDIPTILYSTNNYPLFSFDTRINFKNGETIDYSKAVCQETGIDEEEITDSDIFSMYDIFYILMNNGEFLTTLSNLGYDGPFDLDTDYLSMPSSDLLNLVSRIEWKFRIRLNNNSFYTHVFDYIDLYVSGDKTVELVAGLYQIPSLSTWIDAVIL